MVSNYITQIRRSLAVSLSLSTVLCTTVVAVLPAALAKGVGARYATEDSVQMGGGLGWGYSAVSGNNVSLSFEAHYFPVDDFSFGLETGFQGSSLLSHYEAGPAIQYYLLKEEGRSVYAGLAAIENWLTTPVTYSYPEVRLKLGYNHFLTRSFAVTPYGVYGIPQGKSYPNTYDKPWFQLNVGFVFFP